MTLSRLLFGSATTMNTGNAALHPVALRSATANGAEASLRSTLVNGETEEEQKAIERLAQAETLEEAFSSVEVRDRTRQESFDDISGLRIDPDDYPTLENDSRVRLISAQQYAALAAQEIALNTPESVLFPWLHIGDHHGTPQAAYFGHAGRNTVPPPRCAMTCATLTRQLPRHDDRLRRSATGLAQSCRSAARFVRLADIDDVKLFGRERGDGVERRIVLRAGAYLQPARGR